MHIWSSASSSSINELFKIQKIAIRLKNRASYNALTEVFFKNSAILPLDLPIDYFKLQFVYLFINNHLPVSFANTWINNSARRDYSDGPSLRNALDLFVPYSRLMSTSRHPLISFPKAWNKFNAIEIKFAATKSVCNRALKKVFLLNLSDNPVCNILLCHHGHL
jgi:hypothetical protein